jgi:hypothetical protein
VLNTTSVARTVTMLTICPAVCALTMLADLADAACWAAMANSAGLGWWPPSLVYGDGDVIAAGWSGHAWDCKSGI